MFANAKLSYVPVVLVCAAAFFSMAESASAITFELARKCDALTAKAFPPREIGNPAAGSAKGTGGSEQEYFRKCLARGGQMHHHAPKGSN